MAYLCQTVFISNKNVYSHHFGLQLCCIIPVSQSAILAKAPGVQFPTGCQGCTMRTPAGYVPDTLGFQSLYEPWLVTVPKVRVNYIPHQTSFHRGSPSSVNNISLAISISISISITITTKP